MASIVTSEAWQPVRYAVSGGIGNYIFFHMNRALYQVFQAAAIAWTAAYLLSIPLQQVRTHPLVQRLRANGNMRARIYSRLTPTTRSLRCRSCTGTLSIWASGTSLGAILRSC